MFHSIMVLFWCLQKPSPTHSNNCPDTGCGLGGLGWTLRTPSLHVNAAPEGVPDNEYFTHWCFQDWWHGNPQTTEK